MTSPTVLTQRKQCIYTGSYRTVKQQSFNSLMKQPSA